MRKLLASFALSLLIGFAQAADPIALNPDHPDRYVVVKGDTLWDISARFLQSPWVWPEVWHVNPQIANPHLIYPGDAIVLVYVDGKPQLRVERGRTIKLSPQIRASDLNSAIPAIPWEIVEQFLSRSRVLSEDDLSKAPYVVEIADEHLVGGAGNRVYVRSINEGARKDWQVFRRGEVYQDPLTGEVLGYDAMYVGEAKLKKSGDPATLLLTETARETLVGDRIYSIDEDALRSDFLPHAPDSDIRGQIISVMDGVSQIAQYQVVVINRGEREGIEVGHVLAVDQLGKTIRDTVQKGSKVKLPDELAGYLMVFRVFDKVSYGLIMEATRAMHLDDVVRTP